MLSYSSISKIKTDFKETFKRELRKSSEQEFGSVFHVNRSIIRDVALFLHENAHAHFINLAINDAGEKFELIYEYYVRFLGINKYLFVITEVSKEANKIDSISLIYPQSFNYEIEITKRYGLKFTLLTEEMGEELFVVPTHLIPEGMGENSLPIGVYNKIHGDNFYFHLQIENKTENISYVVEKTGWLYRGIIPLLKNKDLFEDNVRLTKKITGTSSFHHNLAYIMGIEQLAGIKVQKRVDLMRTLSCELERFESHLLFFANLFYLLGYHKSYYYLLSQRTELHELYQKYFKCYFLDEINFVGYTKDINIKDLPVLHDSIEKLLSIIQTKIDFYLYKSYVKERCQGIGILNKEDALEAGVTGPCLRASGINYDVRYEKPYLSYLNKKISQEWNVVQFNDGDVYARVETRLWEIKNSYSIINLVFKELIEDRSNIEPVDMSKIKLPGGAFAITQLESPQGELLYYLKTAEKPGQRTLGGAYICTPSLKNFTALTKYVLKDNLIKNFPLIVHSMDISFNEIDL